MSFLNCRLQDPSHFLAVRHGTPCNASLAYVAGNPGWQQPRSSKRHRPWWLTLCLCVSVCERGGKVSMDCGHWCAKVVAAMREHVDCVWPEVWLSVCVCDSVVVALPEWDFLRKFQLCLLDWMFDDAKVAIVLLLSFFFFLRVCLTSVCWIKLTVMSSGLVFWLLPSCSGIGVQPRAPFASSSGFILHWIFC